MDIKKFKTYFENFANPLLYYIDKDGNSVFRNFCLFKNNGNAYDRVIQIKEAGEIIEYRIDIEKKMRLLSFLFLILSYLIYIHLMYNFCGLVFCELLFIGLIFTTRIHYVSKFNTALINMYGQYSVVNFSPSIDIQKKKEYTKIFLGEIIILLLIIFCFCSFSFVLKGAIKFYANKSVNNYKKADYIAALYSAIYPKSSFIYELRAFKDYANGNFDKAVSNYLYSMDLCGKNFKEKDFTRYANLLYMVKKLSGSQNAIDIFNEYTTKKNLTIPQKTKLLWIKSMFSIANGTPEFVEQDYEDLLLSLNSKDYLNRYYILNDEAYMLYLNKDYKSAIYVYNELIPLASGNDELTKDLPRLHAERGYAKKKINDITGANSDFANSGIKDSEISKYEPKISEPEFINYKL